MELNMQQLQLPLPNPHILKTKKATIEHFKYMLQTNDQWAVKGMLRLYESQTPSEKAIGAVLESNGVGFNDWDVKFMTQAARTWKKKKRLSKRQMACLHRIMPKYAKQLLKLSNI